MSDSSSGAQHGLRTQGEVYELPIPTRYTSAPLEEEFQVLGGIEKLAKGGYALNNHLSIKSLGFQLRV